MPLASAPQLAALFSSAIALAGCALTEPGPDPDGGGEDGPAIGTDSQELLGAPLDPGHLFAVGVCTGAINADGSCPAPGTASTSRCTGTLVTPNLVITARHCVERFGAQSDPADFCSADFNGERINDSVSVTLSDSVLKKESSWTGVRTIHTPATANLCLDDVVLLELGTNIRGVPLAGIHLTRNVAQDPPEEVAIVGRGWIAERYDPETKELLEFDNGGLRRRKLEHIPWYCASDVDGGCSIVDFWSTPPIFFFRAGQLGYARAAAPGDSGAGIYPQEWFSLGIFLIVGVHATSTMAADGDASGGQATRLDHHAPFIRTVVEGAALRGRYPVPFWAE
jgi:Trypsin